MNTEARMTQTSHEDLKILGVKVSGTSKQEVLRFIVSSLARKSKFFVTTPNPEIVVAAQKDHELRAALNSADVAIPDGVGLRLAGIKEVITGRELFEALLSMANRKQLKVYLLGATPEVNKAAVNKIENLCPKIGIRGSGDIQVNEKGYFVDDKNRKRYIDIIKNINRLKPDILFVAFGAPKQEKWVYHNLEKLNVGGAVVVGGALDYLVGKTVLPPAWAAKAGLEWLWRGIFEPWRAKRIFNAVVVFPLLLIKERLKH
jgi:N-acetylglucosaminyldiphosphoundecaprenol N-acetyl-beta-D-mannosaminyltransferase